MGVNPDSAKIASGQIYFNNNKILDADKKINDLDFMEGYCIYSSKCNEFSRSCL